MAAQRLVRAVPAALLAGALASGSVALTAGNALREDLIDMAAREQLLSRKDGQIDHVETTYNDIFVFKHKSELHMAFQLKGWDFTQSSINLKDADDLPLAYTRQMTMAVVYPAELKRILMIGLGGGTISTYLGRHMPDVTHRHGRNRSRRDQPRRRNISASAKASACAISTATAASFSTATSSPTT